ncbi:MAG: DUF2812 domain-containing protein [Anaerovorax sp.]|nr:DUF2812 domain-containing protein [Anaerovorax sp.]
MIEQEKKQKKWVSKIYLLHENELWLNDQAEKGLLLKSFDETTAYFQEGSPAHINYKILILNEKNAVKQIKQIEQQGFTFVGSCNEYYIFYIQGNYAHITPRLNEATMLFVKKWIAIQMLKRVSVTLIAIIPIALKLIINRDNLLQTIMEISTIWYILIGLIFIATAIDAIREYKAIILTKKSFLKQENYFFCKRSKKSNILQNFIIAVCLISVILLIKSIYSDAEQFSISELQKEMPIVLLDDIKYSTVNEDHYAEVKHTILAPNQYYAWQKNQDNFMSIYYYEVAFKEFAEPLAKELSANNFTSINKKDLKKIECSGLDAVYLYQTGGIVNVACCKEKKVMFIRNIGNLQYEEILKKMSEVL